MTFSPYKIMSIARDSTYQVIRARYIELVKKYHPDNSVTGNHEKFVELQRAYEILTNPEDRAMYDRYGLTRGSKEHELTFEAIAKLQELFTSIVAQVDPEKMDNLDLMQSMRKSIQEVMNNVEKALGPMKAQMEQQEKTLEKLKKRLKHRRKNVPNFFLKAFAASVAQFPARIQQLEHTHKIGEEMLRILEDFDYEFIQPQPQYHTTTSTFVFR